MTTKASKLQLDQVIKIGRKEIKITNLVFNNGAFGDYVLVSGIDTVKDLYIKPFTVSPSDKLEVIA